MIRIIFATVAAGATAFAFAGAASAMPIDTGAKPGTAKVTKVAWYCNANGRHCVRAPRAGYALRTNCNWNGSFCAPIVVAPRVVAPAPKVVVKPNAGKVVVRP